MDIEDTTDILLLIENKIHIYFDGKILTIELLEECLSDGDVLIMYKVLDNFYNNCEKNNIFFYILYDFTNLSISSSSSLIYNSSVHQDHLNKHILIFRSYLQNLFVIIQNSTLRSSFDTILDTYKPEIKPILIETIEDIDKHILQ